MHPLAGPCRKLFEAQQQIGVLIHEFKTTISHRIEDVVDPETGETSGYFRVGQYDGLAWSIRIGEVAHNLRSALDGLIFQLGKLNKGAGITPQEQQRSAFPVCKAPEDYKKAKRPKGSVAVLNNQQQAIVETFQPYRFQIGAKESPLYLLHLLNNIDKHRFVPVATVFRSHTTVCNSIFIGLSVNNMLDSGAFCDGGLLYRYSAGGAAIPNLRIRYEIRFGDDCEDLARRSVSAVLCVAHSYAAKIVLAFAPFFPLPMPQYDPYYPEQNAGYERVFSIDEAERTRVVEEWKRNEVEILRAQSLAVGNG